MVGFFHHILLEVGGDPTEIVEIAPPKLQVRVGNFESVVVPRNRVRDLFLFLRLEIPLRLVRLSRSRPSLRPPWREILHFFLIYETFRAGIIPIMSLARQQSRVQRIPLRLGSFIGLATLLVL